LQSRRTARPVGATGCAGAENAWRWRITPG